MFDRARSGAGAVADVADRVVRPFIRLGSAGPVVAAIALGAVAAVCLFLGVESAGNPNPQALAPAAIAGASDFGLRTYSTVSGDVYATYVETYQDRNDNGKQDPDETGRSWFYWLVDRSSRTGVTIRSARTPEEIFAYRATGIILRAESYVSEDLAQFETDIGLESLQFDKAVLIDASAAPSGNTVAYDWESPQADETQVSVTGTMLGTFNVCSSDANGNGSCDTAEVDGWDVLVYDAASRRGVVVYSTTSVEFFPAMFTGMLRRDSKTVADYKTPDNPDFDFATLGITVSNDYFLDDGATPASAPLAFGGAALLGLLALVILAGRQAGCLVFRAAAQPLPGHARSMAVGERLAVKVTGTLVSPTGLTRVREAKAELARIELPPPAAPDGTSVAPEEPARSTLIVERVNRKAGIAVGQGEVAELSAGRVVPLRGPRPAIRLVGATGPLYLSFDSVELRDRAVAELIDESGLTGGLTGTAVAATGAR